MKKPHAGTCGLVLSREAHAVVNYMVRLSAFLFKPRWCAMVKCNTCGLLAVRDEPTNVASEAAEKDRAHAWHDNLDGHTSTSKFFCYAESDTFPRIDTNERLKIVPLIATEITCQPWMKWRTGRSPKEHEEMTILERVRDEQAEFQKTEEARRDQWRSEDQQFQKQLAALAETHHQELRKHGRQIAITAGVVALIAAIIGGLISRQWT